MLSTLANSNARVQFVLGDIFVNSQKARVGQVVKTGDTLKTGAESYMDIKISNNTGFRIKEESVLIVNLVSLDKVRLNSTEGSILSLVREGVDYEVKTPTATAAVRGTIFFMEQMATGETSFCTCNGHVEFSNIKNEKMSLVAAHHKAGAFDERGDFFEQGMVNHTDEEIFNLMFNLDQKIE